eukprot:scaffold459_cov117-Isochrysis_galbana.AAC.4
MSASLSASLRADYGGVLNRCVAIIGRAGAEDEQGSAEMHWKRVNVKKRETSSAVNTVKWLARDSPPISRKSAAFEGQKAHHRSFTQRETRV